MPTRARRRRTPVPKAARLSKAVGKRLRTLREERDWSQAELGRPYLTRAAISALERGVTAPSIHVMAFLSKKLGVAPRDLFPPS
jgi:transcriptional regulator with XRE-family HTH domain